MTHGMPCRSQALMTMLEQRSCTKLSIMSWKQRLIFTPCVSSTVIFGGWPPHTTVMFSHFVISDSRLQLSIAKYR